MTHEIHRICGPHVLDDEIIFKMKTMCWRVHSLLRTNWFGCCCCFGSKIQWITNQRWFFFFCNSKTSNAIWSNNNSRSSNSEHEKTKTVAIEMQESAEKCIIRIQFLFRAILWTKSNYTEFMAVVSVCEQQTIGMSVIIIVSLRFAIYTLH